MWALAWVWVWGWMWVLGYLSEPILVDKQGAGTVPWRQAGAIEQLHCEDT